ncbi:MAG: hypothetical protein IAG13_37145 [Deltaproteobacteria bacterium]|nr:hypothetical protein [Nannocystaceae bacterium]
MAATSVQGCDGENLPGGDICGECGSIASGQLSISGNSRLDGFFTAVADLGNATGTIRAEFDANVRALGQLYGLGEGAVNAEYVADLKAAIRADFEANIEGGIRLVYKPPACQADINVSVEAQASCEVNADCDVQVDPGEASVSCEGKCEGSCSAECEGGFKCTAPSAGIQCMGECEGSCDIDGGAMCEGTCHGECAGNCTATNAAGECHGECDSTCMGSCELAVKAECMGTCRGTCFAEVEPGGCEGEVQCNGTCMGECTGSCQGKFEPPSASAECEASADCQAQASAQAEANISCTPPSLDWQFAFRGGVDASAQAAFSARLGELRVRGVAILQGLARAQALFTGEVDGEVVFDPAPVANITAQVQGLINAGFSGELDIALGRLPCVLPAFEESVNVLGDVATEFSGSIALQADLGASLLNPMAG